MKIGKRGQGVVPTGLPTAPPRATLLCPACSSGLESAKLLCRYFWKGCGFTPGKYPKVSKDGPWTPGSFCF